jgi:Flp pilus assembly protein CpaB
MSNNTFGEFGKNADMTPPGGFGPSVALPEPPSAKKQSKRSRSKLAGKKQKDSDPAKKGSILSGKLAIGMAILAGIAVMLIVTDSGPKTYVARTTVAIAVGQVVVAEQFEIVALAPEAVEPGAIQGATAAAAETIILELVNTNTARARFPLGAREQVNLDDFTTDLILGSTPLLPGEHAVSVEAKLANALAGSVRIGDRVDVVAATGEGLTAIILSNIEVLNVTLPSGELDRIASNGLDGEQAGIPANPIGGTYVLRVQARDLTKIVAVAKGATLWLVGRAANDTSIVSTEALSVIQAMCAGTPQASVCAGVNVPNSVRGISTPLGRPTQPATTQSADTDGLDAPADTTP